jgi:hypothetical protein
VTRTEIAFANDRAIIADMLINILSNVRLTYLPDLEPADAHDLLLIGAHVLMANWGASRRPLAISAARSAALARSSRLAWTS